MRSSWGTFEHRHNVTTARCVSLASTACCSKLSALAQCCCTISHSPVSIVSYRIRQLETWIPPRTHREHTTTTRQHHTTTDGGRQFYVSRGTLQAIAPSSAPTHVRARTNATKKGYTCTWYRRTGISLPPFPPFSFHVFSSDFASARVCNLMTEKRGGETTTPLHTRHHTRQPHHDLFYHAGGEN